MTPEHLLWLAPIVFTVTLAFIVFGPKLDVIRAMRPRVIATRSLADVADQENDAYLNGDGRTGNTLADARMQLFDALIAAEKPSEAAIGHAVAMLGNKDATVDNLTDAVKYLHTGVKDAPVHPGEDWVQYMRRRDREEADRQARADEHERIASRIAAENRASYGQELTEQAVRAMLRPSPSFGRAQEIYAFGQVEPIRSIDTLVANYKTGEVSFIDPCAVARRSGARKTAA